jgi:hypothetical protein
LSPTTFLKTGLYHVLITLVPLALLTLLCLLVVITPQPWESLTLERMSVPLQSSAAMVALYYLGARRHLQFWETFFHELTHTLFSMLTLNRIIHFRATTGQGGEVQYQGRSNWVISLSPYFFPLHTATLLLVAEVVSWEYLGLIKSLLSVSYTFFLITIFNQFSYRQSDITKHGRLFSTVMVVELNFLIATGLLFYIQDELNSLWSWLLFNFNYQLFG